MPISGRAFRIRTDRRNPTNDHLALTTDSGKLPGKKREEQQAHVEQRTWRGGFHGRLDIPATVQLHTGGDPSAFVTRARRRQFDLPENVFVRSLASRSMRLLESLDARELLHGNSWTAHAVKCLASLRRLTASTLLREVPEAPVETFHLQATRNARHPAYRAALRWYEPLVDALDHDDSQRLVLRPESKNRLV